MGRRFSQIMVAALLAGCASASASVPASNSACLEAGLLSPSAGGVWRGCLGAPVPERTRIDFEHHEHANGYEAHILVSAPLPF